MARIYHNCNWKIEVFGQEHGVPHFHLRWPEGRASISIDTLTVIIGSPPPTILTEARQWAEDNRERLWDSWYKLNRR